MDQEAIMLNTESTPSTRPGINLFKLALGYLLAALGLVWVFHDVHMSDSLRSILGINWGWAALAVAFDVLGYLCQARRWQLLLRPVGRLSLLRSAQAIYAGLFINEILPMRLGELLRAYLASRWMPAKLASMFPSMVAERLLDGGWMAFAAGLMVALVHLPEDIVRIVYIFGIIVLAAAIVFVLAVYRKDKSDRDAAIETSGRIRRLIEFVGRLRNGLRVIVASHHLFTAFCLSFGFLAMQALSYWLVMWACGIRLSFWTGASVFLIVQIGTALPNAPANIGTYQFFTVAGLTIFGVEKSLAAGFSIVVFGLLTIPLLLIGFWAFSLSGTRLYTFRNEISRRDMSLST